LNARVNELDRPGVSGELDILRVFCDGDGRHGNALGVVRDPSRHPDRASRQALAAELGFSETVFVDDPERGVVDIHTPALHLPFAGNPLVGTAWLLDLEAVNPPVGEVWTRHDGEFTWITARAEWAPPWRLEQYSTRGRGRRRRRAGCGPGPSPGAGTPWRTRRPARPRCCSPTGSAAR
jgi:hypothetical protein